MVYVEQLPIPNASSEQQASIVTLVDQILADKKADPKTDTGELEASIDDLVYRLYELDKEEQQVVGGAA